MTNTSTRYAPDYATPPGATLLEVLEDQGMSQAELARRTGLSTKHISQISTGRAPISIEVALKLERATGVPARVWNNLESRYREQLARTDEQKRLEQEIGLLDELPIASMVSRGLLTRRVPPTQRLREVFAFFGVTDSRALRLTWKTTLGDFRKSRSHDSDEWAVAVWLRLGEIEANGIDTNPYDSTQFLSTLEAVRSLTREPDPQSWHPHLVHMCAESGVVVSVVDEIPGARTHGAARWLTPNRALIQLSIRYKWSDIFWFTFFHEAKHVLDQAKRSIVLEAKGPDSDRSDTEMAADRFAADFLIPPTHARQLPALQSESAVRSFASMLGIHPGIVVGRLQHDQLWPYSRGTALRERLQLAD